MNPAVVKNNACSSTDPPKAFMRENFHARLGISDISEGGQTISGGGRRCLTMRTGAFGGVDRASRDDDGPEPVRR